MKYQKLMKKAYRAPIIRISELEFDGALLADSVRLRVTVDELENVNAGYSTPAEEASEMYFEF